MKQNFPASAPGDPIMNFSRARELEEKNNAEKSMLGTEGDVSNSRNLPRISDECTHLFSSRNRDRDFSYFFETPPLSHATIDAIIEPEKHDAYQAERKNWQDMKAMESVPKNFVCNSANIFGHTFAMCASEMAVLKPEFDLRQAMTLKEISFERTHHLC